MTEIGRPTVSAAQLWRPDSLREAAVACEKAATGLRDDVALIINGVTGTRDFWSGSAADAARDRAAAIGADTDAVVRALSLAAVAARDGADRIAAAQRTALDVVEAVRKEGFVVADDGTVTPGVLDTPRRALLAAEYGLDENLLQQVLAARAAVLTTRVTAALDALGAADGQAARDIDAALDTVPGPPDTAPAGGWPVTPADIVAGWPAMSQDRIAQQIAAMTPEQRTRLIEEFPHQVGNTDGVPWDMRAAANRLNIADAIAEQRRLLDKPDDQKVREAMTAALGNRPLTPMEAAKFEALMRDDETRRKAIDGHDKPIKERITFYENLIRENADGRQRQILGFDPDRASLIELVGDLKTAKSVGVLVPGLNTTIEGSVADTETVKRFVDAGKGDVAMITYLGGPFPHGKGIEGILDAADPRYALEMAPRLAAFSEDVNRVVDATGRTIPVTYIGHSYGSSILGTAETLGLTADRTLYLAGAGAGVGVDDVSDYRNRNPDVMRYSMTAPGDLIELVQGLPGGPHGADPDEMDGVTRLATGHYDDGRPMAGFPSHSDVINERSDAWDNILAVITGGPLMYYDR